MKIQYVGPAPTDELEVCPQCDGDGWSEEFEELPCERCNGVGEIAVMSVPDKVLVADVTGVMLNSEHEHRRA